MSCLVKPRQTFSIDVDGRIIRFDVSRYYNLTVDKDVYRIKVDGGTLSFSEKIFLREFEYTM